MNGNNAEFINKQIEARVAQLAENKLTPLLAQMVSENAKIQMANQNLESLKKQVAAVKAEMFDVQKQLTEAFSSAVVS